MHDFMEFCNIFV